MLRIRIRTKTTESGSETLSRRITRLTFISTHNNKEGFWEHFLWRQTVFFFKINLKRQCQRNSEFYRMSCCYVGLSKRDCEQDLHFSNPLAKRFRIFYFVLSRSNLFSYFGNWYSVLYVRVGRFSFFEFLHLQIVCCYPSFLDQNLNCVKLTPLLPIVKPQTTCQCIKWKSTHPLLTISNALYYQFWNKKKTWFHHF